MGMTHPQESFTYNWSRNLEGLTPERRWQRKLQRTVQERYKVRNLECRWKWLMLALVSQEIKDWLGQRGGKLLGDMSPRREEGPDPFQ